MPTKATTRSGKHSGRRNRLVGILPTERWSPLEDRRLLTSTITGNATVDEGASYTLQLSSDLPYDSEIWWHIDWGDGLNRRGPQYSNERKPYVRWLEQLCNGAFCVKRLRGRLRVPIR